jgi:hypothetical protein
VSLPTWTQREFAEQYVDLQLFDAPAVNVAGYEVSGFWPSSCNVINWAWSYALISSGHVPPTFVQGNQNGTPTDGLSLSSWSISYTNLNAGGNALFCVCVFKGTYQVAITDTQGNSWVIVSCHHIPFEDRSTLAVLVCADCAPGANTLTITPTGGFGTIFAHISTVIGEYSGASTVAPIPVANPNLGGDSPAPTGILDAILGLVGGPAANTFDSVLSTISPNDLLLMIAATDNACPPFVLDSASVTPPASIIIDPKSVPPLPLPICVLKGPCCYDGYPYLR